VSTIKFFWLLLNSLFTYKNNRSEKIDKMFKLLLDTKSLNILRSFDHEELYQRIETCSQWTKSHLSGDWIKIIKKYCK